MTSIYFKKSTIEYRHFYKNHKQLVIGATACASCLALFVLGTTNIKADTIIADGNVRQSVSNKTLATTDTKSLVSTSAASTSAASTSAASTSAASTSAASTSAASTSAASTSAASTSAASTSAASTSAASTSAASTSAASTSAASTSAASTSADSLNGTVSSIDTNIIVEPSDLAEDQYESWLAYAKEQATIDYQLTGRSQEIVMSDATVLKITIGSSSIPRVDAVDIASYQSWMTQTDFNKLKDLGVKSVIIKVSEGSTYTNPYAKSQIAMAEKAGLNVDVYHYAHFASASAAKSEANYLITVLNSFGLSKDVLIFADMEDTTTYTSSIGNYLNDFWSVLSNSGYTNHAVYTFVSYKYASQVINTVGKSRTWMAQYPYTPTASTEWNTSYGAWQFSSTAYLPGETNAIDVSIDYTGLFELTSKVITYDKITSTKTVNYPVKITETTRNDGLFLNGPYYTSANTMKESASAKTYNGQWALVIKEEVTKQATWVEVQLGNGKTYWMDKRGVEVESYDVVTETKDVNYTAQINQNNRNDGLFVGGPYLTASTALHSSKSASVYDGKTVTIVAEATTKQGTWVEFNIDGTTYWMDKRGIVDI